MKPSRILFIHRNFAGQFRHIAKHLSGRTDFDVKAISREAAPRLKGVALIRYRAVALALGAAGIDSVITEVKP